MFDVFYVCVLIIIQMQIKPKLIMFIVHLFTRLGLIHLDLFYDPFMTFADLSNFVYLDLKVIKNILFHVSMVN